MTKKDVVILLIVIVAAIILGAIFGKMFLDRII